MYTYDTLEKTGFAGMTGCFEEAFSDYELAFTCDETYLNRRFKGSGIDFGKSFGAFEDGKLVGFVLNAVGCYEGQAVIFDAATAVVPSHRGKGIYTHLMQHIRKELEKGNIQKYVLEVLQTNEGAIRLYQKMGFQIAKEFGCFRGGTQVCAPDSDFVPSVALAEEFPLASAISLTSCSPSFENRAEAVTNLASDYSVLYTGTLKTLLAFVVFHKTTGQVKICGRRPDSTEDLKNLLCSLNQEFPQIAVYNIDYRDTGLISLLKDCDFSLYCNQYEMDLSI